MSALTRPKICFLDVDGVLNSIDWLERRGPRPPERSHLAHNVDPAALARLNQLCERTGARVVVSSTWRHGCSVRRLQRDFRGLGLTGRIIGKTPELRGVERGEEIRRWLLTHEGLAPFVILDDEADMGPFVGHLVQTAHTIGLTDADVERAVALLGGGKAATAGPI